MTSVHYSLTYEGDERDTRYIDVRQVRLVCHADHEYHQFFLALLAMDNVNHLVRANDPSLSQLVRAAAVLAGTEILVWLQQGSAPLDNPSQAIELRINPTEAVEIARSQSNESLQAGEIVAEWTIPGQSSE